MKLPIGWDEAMGYGDFMKELFGVGNRHKNMATGPVRTVGDLRKIMQRMSSLSDDATLPVDLSEAVNAFEKHIP